MLTVYQAKVIAWELTQRKGDTLSRIAETLADIPVDLNPHQIDAAIVALNSPFAKGVIFADEVGLGKTIEAGIVAAQLFSSGKKRQLVLCTPGLRKHWADQLSQHFQLPVAILDEDQREAAGPRLVLPHRCQQSAARCLLDENKFPQIDLTEKLPEFDGVLIASYAFLNRYESLFAGRTWDLLVIDEAHRLRKLYKETLKTTQAVQRSLFADKTILITAFPLQYSLLDIYSLTQLIDETIFGSEDFFRERFMTSNSDIAELRTRLAPCLVRTLRRQVLEFVPMTKRTSLTAAFTPTPDQKKLFKAVAEYFFKKDRFSGIPPTVQVMWNTFIQKAMASSVPALISILQTIRQRISGENISLAEAQRRGEESEFETLPDSSIDNDMAREDSDLEPLRPCVSARNNTNEIEQLDRFIAAAKQIGNEPKAEMLLMSLQTGFQRMKTVGANEKALIFTESLATQQFLKEFLEANGYAGKVVIFNGQNNSPESRKIYRDWLFVNKGTSKISGVPGADLRQSLIDYFQNTASVMITTEAGSEGLDLQFCSFVINYDLPFNPMQLEWRIGRCHRYGQKFDVVVINFLNNESLVDRKAYELLSNRFSLFDGMFGSSDEVFGSLESASQFEKKIAKIMRTCRTESEIETAFDDLQKEYEESVKEGMTSARKVLFEQIDRKVIERFQVRIGHVQNRLDRRTELFWKLLKYYYRDKYWFDDTLFTFGFSGSKKAFYQLGTRQRPLSVESLLENKPGKTDQPIPINPSDSTAQMIYEKIKAEPLPPVQLDFTLSESNREKYAELLNQSRSGWLRLDILSLDGFTQSDELVYTLCDESGRVLPSKFAQTLMESVAVVSEQPYRDCPFESELETELNRNMSELIQKMEQSGQRLFEEETAKIDRYASDLQLALDLEVRRLNKRLEQIHAKYKQQRDFTAKVALGRQKSTLEKERSEKMRLQLNRQEEIRQTRDMLLEQLEAQISGTKSSVSQLFLIEWSVKNSIMRNSMESVAVPE